MLSNIWYFIKPPKMYFFSIHEGNLVGYVVSIEGITMDLERIVAILEFPLPQYKKGLQSFISYINFVRRFLPHIATLLKPLTTILKNNAKFKWTREAKDSFQLIKEVLASAPTLANLDFSKDFILCAFGGFNVISTILVHKNVEGWEQPITFFSKGLEDYEQRYTFVEKKVLDVVKILNKFRNFLSHNKIHLQVAHPSVKDFLLSKDLNEKWVGWITRFMEYDVDFQVTKLVRGKVLCQQLAKEDISVMDQEKESTLVNVGTIDNGITSWLSEMSHFLKTRECPPNLCSTKRRYFRLQSIPFIFTDDVFYRKDHSGV